MRAIQRGRRYLEAANRIFNLMNRKLVKLLTQLIAILTKLAS